MSQSLNEQSPTLTKPTIRNELTEIIMNKELTEKLEELVNYWDKPAAAVADLLLPEIERLTADLESNEASYQTQLDNIVGHVERLTALVQTTKQCPDCGKPRGYNQNCVNPIHSMASIEATEQVENERTD